jgi:DNA-binding ferritin-like protein
MEEILIKLFAIEQKASDIHYNFKSGNSYFAVHKLMDEVREPINDFMDEIKEVIYLGHDEPAPNSKLIIDGASALLSDSLDLSYLVSLMDNAIQAIENIKSELDSGSSKVVDDISAHLLKYRGLVKKSID